MALQNDISVSELQVQTKLNPIVGAIQKTEDVTYDNFAISQKVIDFLRPYQSIFLKKDIPESFTHLNFFGGNIDAQLLLPKDVSISKIFTDDPDENMDIVNEYNGEFFSDDNEGMFLKNHYSINFYHEVDNIKTLYTFRTPKESIPSDVLAPCFSRAVEKYCELFGIQDIDAPFIMGSLMLSTSSQSFSEKHNLADWFMLCINNFLDLCDK